MNDDITAKHKVNY